MRTRNARGVLAGLAAAAVFVGGSIAARNGPLGGGAQSVSQRAAPPAHGAAPATGPTGSLRPLGSLSVRLARLPALAAGELQGSLDVVADGCSLQTIALATLVRSHPTPPGLCAAPGGRLAVRINDPSPHQLTVVDLSGRPVATILLPDGWDAVGITRQGVVLCSRPSGSARLRRFRGGSVALPSCPVGQSRAGLLFAGPHRRSIVDGHGRRLAALERPLASQSPIVRAIGDALLVVDSALYRDGRLLATFATADVVVGASRDGSVALVSNGVGTHLQVYRDGTAHAIDPALSTHGGAVAPDGRRLFVEHDPSELVELDARTLRPLARLDLAPAAQVVDWRP